MATPGEVANFNEFNALRCQTVITARIDTKGIFWGLTNLRVPDRWPLGGKQERQKCHVRWFDKPKRRGRHVGIAALRVAQINRLFRARYGETLPDDDAGRDDAEVMAHHLAHRGSGAERRIASWVALRAPWMSAVEVAAMIARVIAKPIRWRADALGKLLRLTDAERTELKITTIGSVDVPRAERIKRRRERARQRMAARRRAKKTAAVTRPPVCLAGVSGGKDLGDWRMTDPPPARCSLGNKRHDPK